MKRWFWRLFPKTTESMDEFVDFVLSNKCSYVEVVPLYHNFGLLGGAGFSLFSLYPESELIGSKYSVVCRGMSPSGKKMEYMQQCVTQWVAPREWARDHEQNTTKLFYAAERCIPLLKERIRAIPVQITGLQEFFREWGATP